MKLRYILVLLCSFLIVSVFLTYGLFTSETPKLDQSDFFVGIDVAYAGTGEIKALIDEVSSYTNLFLVGSTGISHNSTKLNEICQYLYEKDMYFIVYDEDTRALSSLVDVRDRWEDRFLGLQYEDEMGGSQLDVWEFRSVDYATNHSDAANQFVYAVGQYLNRQWIPFRPVPSDFHLFTADYALYWFDYEAGYDVVLAEFGWNYSRQLNVALCRGAAAVQDKEWGVIVAWTYDSPPYIESGSELYDDLVLAYENGAKYVVVFDSNKDYTGGILQQEHLEALKRFWQYKEDHPRSMDQSGERVAYVLPRDYAYGFRGPNDKIWGLWEADEFSFEISENLGALLEQYGDRLDVIYDDGLVLDATYGKYIFWNNTIIVP